MSPAFDKREILALHFAEAIIGARDGNPEHPGRSNRNVVLDAFAFADAFLDERNRSFPRDPDHHAPLGQCSCH